VALKAGGNQQQRAASEAQRCVDVRRLANVAKRDLDRRTESNAGQNEGPEPSTGAPSAPPLDCFEEDVAADGDGGHRDHRDGKREGDVDPVQAHCGLQKVSQLAQCEQGRPGDGK
jgi:hypothetical protein